VDIKILKITMNLKKITMKTKKITIILCLFSIIILAQNTKKDELYIRRFAQIAVNEMKLHKIPASITLGQGLLETANGQSELAQNANNHFGIKCKETWTGETYRYTDDAYMECFRKYKDPEESYKDHSQFLLTRKHYNPLFQLDSYDYKGWAFGLKKSGYATNPKYSQILISRIEKYKLYEFDKLEVSQIVAKLDDLYPETKSFSKNTETLLTKNDDSNTVIAVDPPLNNSLQNTPSITEISKNKPFENKEIFVKNEIDTFSKEQVKKIFNKIKTVEKPKNTNDRILEHKNKGLKYIIVQNNETLKNISEWFNIPISELKNFNDLSKVNDLKENQILFLEHKRSKGREKFYTVKNDDTLYSVSQNEGIKMEELCYRNNLKSDISLKAGDVLNLRGKKSD